MGSSTVEQRIEHEQMQALARGVRQGRNKYEDDLDALANGLNNARYRSYVASALYNKMESTLKKRSISDDFDSVISRINYYT